MAETYTTKALKFAISDYFQREYGIKLEEEKRIEDKYVKKVDLGFAGDKEIGIEIKISRYDLASSAGHNHGIQCSYLAIPWTLYWYAKEWLIKEQLDDVGIIVILENDRVVIDKKAKIQGNPTQFFRKEDNDGR